MLSHLLGVLVSAFQSSSSPPPTTEGAPPSMLYFADLDGDDLDDALVIGRRGEVTFLVNRGEGRFEDITSASGLTAIDFASCAAFADFDGDGRLDLFAGSGEVRLWRNVGQATFEPFSGRIDHDLIDLGALVLDHDKDGRLDLHVRTEAGDIFYRNAGNGHFERVELVGAASPNPLGVTLQAIRGDADQAAAEGAPAAVSDESDATPARRRQLRWLRGRSAAAGATASAEATSGGTSSNALGGGSGVTSTNVGSFPAAGGTGSICAETIVDQATGLCIEASSIGSLGKLYPLSADLFVDSATGNVGVGTTGPLYTLHVDGKVVSGVNTSATGTNAAVGGGASNTASGVHSVVAGGESNTAGSAHSFIGGGLSNATTGTRSVVGGGISNRAGNSAVVGGGSNNQANFNFGAVTGGRGNVADAPYAAIGGGADNLASGLYSVVGGGGEDGVAGSGNIASGVAATVPGGRANVAAGTTSLAAGQRAKALHNGSFVWADSLAADFASTGPDQFAIRATGGVGIGTGSPTAGLHLVSDQGFVATGTLGTGTIPVAGGGTRMMWYPRRAAFRAGTIPGGQWDDVNVGEISTALGNSTTASGNNSLATGLWTNANAYVASAFGRFNVGGGNKFNWIGTDPLFEIGNGLSSNARANAVTVLKNGNVGIGTAVPASTLHVDSAAGGDIVQFNAAGANAGSALISTSQGSSGTGVYASAEHTTGVNYGLYAVTASPNGFAGFFDGMTQFIGGTDAAIAGGGYAAFGRTSSQNVVIDSNEIMARNNGAAAALSFNNEGGDVHILSTDVGGNVGIGTTSPQARLQIDTTSAGTEDGLRVRIGSSTKLILQRDGDLGIGLSNPQYPLHVVTNTDDYATQIVNGAATGSKGVRVRVSGTGTNTVLDQLGTGKIIEAYNASGRVFEVLNSGRVVTSALEITGGGDLVEAFDSREGEVEPGSVMCIDTVNPGGLTLSTEPYDTRVAGVVSGAGGVNHGIQLTQRGVLEGDTLLAMTGRVWAKCSAENGAIQAGDRLTTAALVGHAMRASDDRRAPGAVIGKAMTGLESGTGLVLVLVNLQ